MIGLDVILYSYVCGAMLVMSVLGLESAVSSLSLDRPSKRFFTAFFAALVTGSASFFLELVVYVYPDLTALQIIVYFLQSLIFTVPFPLLAGYLLYCCGENWWKHLLFRTVLALWVAYFSLLIISNFTTFFWYIEEPNQLRFGPGYPLLLAPVLAMLLLVGVGVLRRRAEMSRQYYRAFLICLTPVTIALFVHAITPVFTLVYVGLTVSAFAMYRIIMTDTMEQERRHQQEIANQRASIAVLQMRPHFIYNTMTSIYYLCDEDPELAKQVTMYFTTYLRKNLAAIASEETIPFSEELEHTRAYLAVEQAQFGDNLVIDYDTPHTQFRMPPLTLQPIVENAVKHGMDPDSGPLHILVRTRETDTSSEVIVENDGPSFESAIADKPHTTLANIRQRLEMMCGGTMTISPREGDGVVVRLTVPRGE